MPLLLNINAEYFDPIMGMTVPTSATPGQQYALDITNDLITRIAPHTHTGAANLDGYQLNSDALDITMDLQLNGTNLGGVRSVQFESQSTVLTGAEDINDWYFVNGNAYVNDGNGTPIRITESGQLASSFSFLNFTSFNINITPYFILYTDPYNLYNVDSTSLQINITLPPISLLSPGSGRFYIFKDVGNNAGTNNIVVNVAAGSLNLFSNGFNTFTINSNGGYFGIYVNTSAPGAELNIWTVFEQSVYDTEVLQLNTSALNINLSTINLTNGSQLNIDSTSLLTVNGDAIFNNVVGFAANTSFNGNVNLESTVAFGSTSASTFYTGGSITIQTGVTVNALLTLGTLNFTGTRLNLNTGTTTTLTTGTILNVDSGAMTTFNNTPIFNASTTFNGALNFNGVISATSGSVVQYLSCNVPLPASGNVMLTASQYNCPIIDMLTGSVGTLTGDVIIIFPVSTGIWDIQFNSNLTFAGHSVYIQMAGHTSVQFVGPTPNISIIRVVASTGQLTAVGLSV